MNRRFTIPVVLLIVSFIFLLPEGVRAQRWKFRRYEVGLGMGSVQVFGDIGGTASQENWFGLKDIKFDETKLGFVSHARYKMNPKSSIRANLNLGFGKGTDEDSRNDRGRAYNTTLIEFSGQYEYYFLPEDKQYRSAAMYSRRGMVNNYSMLGAYVFAGAGVTYAISSHADAPVGPNDDYRPGGNIVPVIPLGVGVKYILNERNFLNAELGYRIGLTDYIEGFKQTEASKFTDVYYFLTISYYYRLKTTPRNLPSFLDRKYKRYGY